MPRHSKNNTALGFFTYAETKALKYGTKKQRLGKDSMRKFDDCILCLSKAVSPVSCQQGHILCKECALTNILAQKQQIKRQRIEAEKQKMLLEEKLGREEQEAKQRILVDFEKAQSSITTKVKFDTDSIDKVGSNNSDEPRGVKRKIKFNADEQLESAKKEKEEALAKIMLDKAEKLKSSLPSFWSPSLTPTTNKIEIKEVKIHAQCAGSEQDHELSLKRLIDVNFTTDGNEKHMNICPSCRKELLNPSKPHLSKKCGHVFCKACIDQFVKTSQACFVCSQNMKQEDLVPMSVDGTGFSSGGTAQVTKYDVAFS